MEQPPKRQRTRAVQRPLRSKKTDPQGSYTGCPVNPLEKPVQDADDL